MKEIIKEKFYVVMILLSLVLVISASIHIQGISSTKEYTESLFVKVEAFSLLVLIAMNILNVLRAIVSVLKKQFTRFSAISIIGVISIICMVVACQIDAPTLLYAT